MNITHGGTTQPVEEWALDYGLDPFILSLRLEAGWPPADAIETPLDHAPGYRLPDYCDACLLPPDTGTSDRPDDRRTPAEQRRKGGNPNGRETSVFIEHGGLRLSLKEWSARLNVPRGTLYARLRAGHPAASILAPSYGRRRARRARLAAGGKQLSSNAAETGAPVTRKIASK